MAGHADLPRTILDTALSLAEQSSWEALRLHDVASALHISLDEIRQHYPQKDDLVEAWYDRADSAMLRSVADPGFLQLPMQERLHKVMMAWFDALAQHKKISSDMLLYKLEPGHVHLQVLGILRISRTVQWFREAAQQDATHLQRILEEIGLTSIYLMTFLYWINDRSENQRRTRTFLRDKLECAEHCAKRTQGWLDSVRSRRTRGVEN